MDIFLLILRWLVPLWLLGWLVLPLSQRLFRNLPDGGLAAGRILTLFGSSLIAFWTAALHLLPLTLSPFWLLLPPLASLWLMWRHAAWRQELLGWIKTHRRALLVSDAIFLIAYVLFVWIRLCKPTIFDLEKPMDAALIASAARAVWLPFDNPWLAGVPFTNYYYFGPVMAGNLARLFATPTAYAYNLIQPLFCALFLSALWALCSGVAGNLWRGVVGMSLVGLFGHFEPVRQMVENGQLILNPLKLNWWNTSRVVPDTTPGTNDIAINGQGTIAYTINEYPVFTLAIGDVHAHFYALALAALLFSLCWALFATPQSTSKMAVAPPAEEALLSKNARRKQRREAQQREAESALPESVNPSQSTLIESAGVLPWQLTRRRILLLLMGALLGGFIITNTWDVPLYTLLLLACAFLTRPVRLSRSPLWKDVEVLWCLLPLLLAPLVAFPYLRLFKSQVKGVARELWLPNAASFLLYWGGWLALALLVVVAYHGFKDRLHGKDRAPVFLMMMGALGLVAMLAPCFFYIRGFFSPEYRHQDTVFKFYLQGWLLLGTATSCGALWLLAQTRLAVRRLWGSLWAVAWVVPALCGTCVVLWRSLTYPQNHPVNTIGLSLNAAHPRSTQDYAAMEWLRQNAKPGEAVLEAVKPGGGIASYHEFGRVAALTGVPSVLGWTQHVWFWGADLNEDIEPRRLLIDQVYRWPSDEEAQISVNKLQFWNVRYVFVGELERGQYPPASLEKLRSHYPVVYENQGAFIVRVP